MATKGMPLDPYTQALLWTCTTCGFLREGKQPHMECPSCEGQKTAFVNLPQHLEVEVRASLGRKGVPNSQKGRQQRLSLLRDSGAASNFYVKGRFLP